MRRVLSLTDMALHDYGLHAVIWVCTVTLCHECSLTYCQSAILLYIMNAGGSTKQSDGYQRIYPKQVNTLLLEERINLLVLPLKVKNAA